MPEEPLVQQTIVRQTTGTGDGGKPIPIGVAGVGGPAPIQVVAYPWWQLMGVRGARAGLQAFASVLGIGATGLPEYVLNISATDFATKLKLAALIGAGTAAASMLQDTIEFLKSWDVTHPQLRG